jgi:hypothetical protein
MKLTIRVLILVTIAAFAIPVLAQSKDCTDENKSAWYDTFYKNYKGELAQQKVAYDAAKQYVACVSDPNDQYVKYLQRFVDAYDKLQGAQTVGKQFEEAVTKHNYPDQMKLGKQVLANDAENPAVNIILGMSGVFNAGVLNDSLSYAKKAIELIEAGKPTAPYGKDQALAYLHWDIGKATLDSAPVEAIPHLVTAAKLESEVKKNPLLYLDLASAYEKGPRTKLTDEYKSKLGPNNTETPESKLVLENLNQNIDRQIDAWARAAALSTNAGDKKNVMDALTELYKYRNKSDTGLGDLIASVLTKPVPDMPTPITSLPTPTPTSTPGNNGAATNGGAGSSGGAKPAGSTTPASSSTGKQSGSNPAANKPKPRLNHRAG